MSDQDKPARKKMGLGRGLDALFGEAALERNAERVAGGGCCIWRWLVQP